MRQQSRINPAQYLRKDDTKVNKYVPSKTDEAKNYNLIIEPQSLILSTRQLKSHLDHNLQNNINDQRQLDREHDIYMSQDQNEYMLKRNQQELREINNQLNAQLIDKERRLSILSQSLLLSEQDREQLKQKEVQYMKMYEMREDKNQEELKEIVNQLNAQLMDQQRELSFLRERSLISEQTQKQINQNEVQLFQHYEMKDERAYSDLREINKQLNDKLLDQERELSNIRQNQTVSEQDREQLRSKEVQYVKHYETREDEFLQLLRSERQRNQDLQCEVEYFSKELRFRDDNFKKLEESQITLNRIIEDQQKRIEDEKINQMDIKDQLKGANEKLEVSQKSLQNMEQRYCKSKTKYEGEVQVLKEDKLKYLKKYKAKISEMKPLLKNNEEQINQIRLENIKLKSEQMIPTLEKQNLANIQNYTQQNENERLLQINNQLSEAYQSRSEEFSQQGYRLQQAVNHLEKLTSQYESTQQEYDKLLYNYEKVQDDMKNVQLMLDQVCDMGHSQMDDLDSKVSRMNTQLQQANSDKNNLMKENSRLRQEAQNVEMNEQMLEKHIQKQKKENKMLQRQLGELNTNLKEIIVEKHSEMKSNSKMHSQNMSYISMKNKVSQKILIQQMDHLLSSNSKRDFLRIEEDSMQDI